MVIYKITNIINNKVYIGQTSQKRPSNRINRHFTDALNNILDTKFCRAIRKYGRDNFKWEIIDSAKTKNELNKKEKFWIKYYDSIQNGYNMVEGGIGFIGNSYGGKSKEELNRIKEKIRKSKIGSNNPHSRRIKCLNEENGEEIIFETLEKCRLYFNEKTHRFITTRVTGQTKSLYKKIWNFAYINQEYIKRTKEIIFPNAIPIKVLDLISQEERIYSSMNSVEKELKIDHTKISHQIKKNNFYKDDHYKITLKELVSTIPDEL